MIADLKPYPAMKDSGELWLDKVPEHWALRRTKTLLHPRSEKGFPDEPLLTATQTKGVVRKEKYENRTVLALKDLHLLKLVRVGDFVISLRSFQGGIEYAREQGIISPAYTILYPVERDSHAYIAHVFKSKPYIENLSLFVTGIRQGQNIDYEKLSRSLLPYPPRLEQAAIVRFLDHADRRIRRYIRAKQKLIALLEEQKQVLIYGAVTRGLDPNVRLKPSGVEWLGDVPEHWGIRRSKRTFTPRKELARPNDIQLSATQAYGVIAQEDYEERVRRKIVKISRHLEKRRHVEVDDFVISMRSFQGGLERAWVSGCIRSSYIVLQPAARLNVGYFGYLFKSVGYITALQSTANFIRDGQDLNFENFCGVDLPYLPIEEQRRIAQFLDDATADITTTIERSRREIDLFGEYRTRLIADVVTGKLDVRGAADGLPEVDSLADDDALTTQAAETGVMELEDATESPEEFAMENEATV